MPPRIRLTAKFSRSLMLVLSFSVLMVFCHRGQAQTLTDNMREQMGAAAWIPQHAGVFSSGLNYGER